MGRIVDLAEYRKQSAGRKGFAPWHRRFGETFDDGMCLTDLSDRTLYQLALPGEESALALYELIMGALDLGHAAKFPYLGKAGQMKVMEIHLLLADLVRFEMMRRLEWLDHPTGVEYPIVEMVRSYVTVKIHFTKYPPTLSQAHPEYADYEKLHERDREAFIRRLLTPALDAFKERVKNSF